MATVGYVGRIINSLKEVILGLILFVASFFLLYWNEGQIDLSNIAKTATQISSAAVNTDPALNGRLISTTGVVNSDQIIGDNLFLKPDRFIAVERKVEMFAWVEKQETRSKTNVGGSETTETTYTYTRGWEEHPSSSSNFKYPEGHENPQKALDNYTNKASAATIGVYNFDPQSITLPKFSKLPLNSQNVILSPEVVLANDTYLFIRKSEGGTFENPQVGDLRISYNVLYPNFEGTIFGKLNGNKIDPYFDKDNNRLYRLFTGTRDTAIATLHNEHVMRLWILRLIGFLLMWFGLMFLFAPISVFLDVLPVFGAISRLVVGLTTFVVALVLTIITILMSMVVHNLAALIITLFIASGAVVAFFILRKNKRRASSGIAAATASIPTSAPASQLESYVREARARGMSNDEIRRQLLAVGWPSDQINKVLG